MKVKIPIRIARHAAQMLSPTGTVVGSLCLPHFIAVCQLPNSVDILGQRGVLTCSTEELRGGRRIWVARRRWIGATRLSDTTLTWARRAPEELEGVCRTFDRQTELYCFELMRGNMKLFPLERIVPVWLRYRRVTPRG